VAQTSLTCPRCLRTTNHPKNFEEGYCGGCRGWTSLRRIDRAKIAGALEACDTDALGEVLIGLAETYRDELVEIQATAILLEMPSQIRDYWHTHDASDERHPLSEREKAAFVAMLARERGRHGV